MQITIKLNYLGNRYHNKKTLVVLKCGPVLVGSGTFPGHWHEDRVREKLSRGISRRFKLTPAGMGLLAANGFNLGDTRTKECAV